jgi:glycosyltransferase involved in cell wall biosynthesis
MALGSGTNAPVNLPGLSGRVDVALLSLGTTLGLRHADDALAELLAAAGLSCRVVRVRFGASGRLRRQITVIDVVEGLAARRGARATRDARAVIVSGATTALLLDRPEVPWAIRFDSPTALNREGWSGAWQRARERHVFRTADVLLPWGRAAAEAAAPLVDGAPTRTIPLPVPVEPPERAAPSDSSGTGIEVVAYAGWLWKRGVDILCAAWAEAAPAGARLVIGGADRAAGLAWLDRCGVAEPPGVEWAGALPHDDWLARVARAHAFVNASRREDHGLAQLEALAAGTPLITVPSPGAYEALPIARALAPELVAADVSAPALATALRAGLALQDRERYAERATAAMAPYRREAVLAVVRDEVAPALGLA